MEDVADNLTEVLRQAAHVVEAAGLPTDLRTEAFRFCLAHALTSSPEARGDQRSGDASDWAASVARHIGIDDVRLVEESLHWEDDRLEVTVVRDSLDPTKAEAQRQLTLLAVGALEELNDDWVPIDAVRDVCQDFGVYDRNLSANVRSLGGVIRVRGSGTEMKFRLTEPGRRAAAGVLRASRGSQREE